MAQKSAAVAAAISGAWRFALVSILGFAPWALPRHGGEGQLYFECLIAFLVFAQVLLVPMVHRENRYKRFNSSFVPAFIAYAVVWSACWFAFRAKGGEIAGLILGCLAFAWVLGKRLRSTDGLGSVVLVLILAHAAGYWLGSYVFSMARNPPALFSGWDKKDIWTLAKLSWGLFYGLGFGAGIGYAFYRFQQTSKSAATQN